MSEGAAGGARDAEDAAVVLTVIAALAARATSGAGPEPVAPRSFWGRPGYRITGATAGPHGWWASGLPR